MILPPSPPKCVLGQKEVDRQEGHTYQGVNQKTHLLCSETSLNSWLENWGWENLAGLLIFVSCVYSSDDDILEDMLICKVLHGETTAEGIFNRMFFHWASYQQRETMCPRRGRQVIAAGNSRLKCWDNEQNVDKMEQFVVRLNEKSGPQSWLL